MFDRMLIPVDGSPESQQTAEAASRLAERLDARLVLVRVEGALTAPARALADHHELEHLAAMLRQHGLSVHSAIEFGQSDRALAAIAEAEGARLIVMPADRRSGFNAIRHPGAIGHLLGHISTPLLIWPASESGRARQGFLDLAGSLVMVPLDGSPLAEHALPYAVGLAREYDRPLMLVHVVRPPEMLGMGPEVHRSEREHQARTEREAHAYLCATRQRLNQEYPHLSVQSMILRGEPWRELVRCAETHDGSILVMSTHGHGGVHRALLGSVSAHLARVTPLPLLIIPPNSALDEPLGTAVMAVAHHAASSAEEA